jgi:hypothetical protein
VFAKFIRVSPKIHLFIYHIHFFVMLVFARESMRIGYGWGIEGGDHVFGDPCVTSRFFFLCLCVIVAMNKKTYRVLISLWDGWPVICSFLVALDLS